MTTVYENTYWNHKGNQEVTYAALRKFVPASGEVVNPKQNPALERFRRACNCYYDLYNNGLCNRRREFYGIFKIATAGRDFTISLVNAIEDKMNQIITAAAKEQGIA